MDIKGIISALPIFALLCACQSEAPKDTTETGRVLTVKATLPGSDETRTHITYGNPSIDTELFGWDMEKYGAEQDDWISLYNVTRLEEWPYSLNGGIKLEVTNINGRSATFQSVSSVNPDIEIKAGDVLFINYWETTARHSFDSKNNLIYHPNKVFSISFGTEGNSPQYIEKDPEVDSYMSYMQGNLRMYDIVTVVEDEKIPDLHFKWLSAIIRITLRNETGHDIYPTKLEVEYPGTESFFNTTLYCSVDTEASNESGLIIHDDYNNKDYEFYKGSAAYTDHIGTTINGKDGIADAGESIAPGQTYDLYLSTVPRINNEQTGDSITIDLIDSHVTKHPYTITLKDFKVPIKAGKRYWFNLTAVEENYGTTRKLMLTSDWLKAHPEAEPVNK